MNRLRGRRHQPEHAGAATPVAAPLPDRRRWWQRLLASEPEVALALAGVALPLVLVLEPPQPLRALGAGALLLLLPGLALLRVFPLADLVLGLLVAVSTSVALTVLVSTALMYADVWSWQLTLLLLGGLVVVLSGWSGWRRSA